ncbi:hypothetical protein A0H81_10273 [Grifola frondosa]|uniref:Uncharacterized protein n=1 Tax=Grifola frondosa TaxID=5627 RepID=A0A1C7LYR9_GRIFR|nr:hypothetical protein A0H81_10273 [Grifola frondosa]
MPGPIDPDPALDFDLTKATTRNHVYVNKTLRHPYFQTMAHQPMHINHWIEIDKEYQWYLAEKAKVIKEQGKKVLDSLPENDDACAELLEILVDYLIKRYPTLFSKLDKESGDGIWNKVTDEKLVGLTGKSGVDALLMVSRLVQDDFLMARERADGHIYLVGGLVGFPGFYLLSETIGRAVHTIHAPVPYFNQKLLMSVERTLKRFGPDQSFERSSWSIVDDRNLFWHHSVSESIHEQLHAKDLWLRVDHQTFRKLPRTQVIVFGVHPMMKRMEDLEDSPLVPALLAKIHTDSEQCLLDYKGAPKYSELLIPYLRELTQRQIERGLIQASDDVREFRDLVKDGRIPNTQSSLAEPTESETLIGQMG